MSDADTQDPTATTLAQKLRAARVQAGLSQEQVAQRIGLGRVAVSAMEVGRRRVSSLELKALAEVYGQPVEHFLAQDVVATSSPKDGAEGADPTLTLLARAIRQLTPHDREEVLRFAEFLRSTGREGR